MTQVRVVEYKYLQSHYSTIDYNDDKSQTFCDNHRDHFSKMADGHVLPRGNSITTMIPVCFHSLHSLLCPEIKNTSWDLVSHHCVTYVSYILKANHVKGIRNGENAIPM